VHQYIGLGLFLIKKYFFPSHGKKWVFTGKKSFLPGRNGKETPKCNNKQWLLSRLHKVFDIYHAISCLRYGLVCKAKDNTRTNLPIDRLLSNLYTWWFVSLFVLWIWKENVLKHCFNCCYYKRYKQAFQINSCYFHTDKPKLVTQPAIVHGFFLTLSF